MGSRLLPPAGVLGTQNETEIKKMSASVILSYKNVLNIKKVVLIQYRFIVFAGGNRNKTQSNKRE